ncbi:hypothetical protein OSB04_028519 [Centaurea solstitialis]|uniref:Retrotransposon gag domain-containing protein n=1 Tax=Centaurea solstitialis TaxID=347529 RepID=A0AA38SNA5_9ASTR|nr:hypothetical protein OSB04_028519 [Centaurea solstitialis]
MTNTTIKRLLTKHNVNRKHDSRHDTDNTTTDDQRSNPQRIGTTLTFTLVSASYPRICVYVSLRFTLCDKNLRNANGEYTATGTTVRLAARPPWIDRKNYSGCVLEAVERKSTKKGEKSVEIGQTQLREHLAFAVTTELLEAFEEPEREFRKRNKKKSKANKVPPRALNFEMGDDAPMWTARRTAPTVPTNPITKPDLNKEILGKLLHMIKDPTFDGKNDSNPIVHMENFADICDLFKTEEGRDDAIPLRIFPLTLAGEAKAWLRSLELSSITTWKGLRSKFISRFFPPSKIDKLRAKIRSFRQDDEETISESWERFKHLLNSCPSHGLSKSEQVQRFYSGLGYSSRATLDSSAGGVFMQIPRMAGKISTDFDPSDELAAMKNQQVKFERKIEQLIKSVHALQVECEECKGPHQTKDCPNRPMMTPEEVHYLNRGDYQGSWNNHRNFIPRPPGFFAPNQQNQQRGRAACFHRGSTHPIHGCTKEDQ